MIEQDRATDKYRRLYRQLRDEVNGSWKATWRELNQYINPYSGRYLSSDSVNKDNNGERRDQKILNGVAFESLRTLAAGMHGGLTSPSRPWFTIGVPDDALMELEPVKVWLHAVRQRMLTVFARSNFYSSIHQVYEELGQYGTAVMLIEEDMEQAVKFRAYTCGEYLLGGGKDYQTPGVLFRRFSLTARQLVEMFREKDGVWDNITQRTRSLYENGRSEERVLVIHALMPTAERRGMQYESVYYELDGGEEDKILRRGYYSERPFVSPRWDVSGSDVYGTGCGWQALGDIKQLQSMEKKKLKALDKMIDPPLNAPTSMKNETVTTLPGQVNFVDALSGAQGLSPTYMVNPQLQSFALATQEVENRIKRLFYYDMFLSLASATKRMTATEVQQRYEEKLMVLGSVIERLEKELLNPVVERVFNIMLRLNLIPEAPAEMQGMELKVEYISLLAQAQKMVGSGSIEKVAAFVGGLAAVNPDVLDKLDFDQLVDEYGAMQGLPPKVIRSDDAVAQLRENKAQQMAQQQQFAAAQQMADSAKVMSETKINQGSALDALMGAPL